MSFLVQYNKKIFSHQRLKFFGVHMHRRKAGRFRGKYEAQEKRPEWDKLSSTGLFSKSNKIVFRNLFAFAVKVYIVHDAFLCCRVLHDLIFGEPKSNFTLCFFWRF